MTGKPGQKNNERDIPYPANTPQYNKYWRLTTLAGKTHDEAKEIMKTWVPGKKKGEVWVSREKKGAAHSTSIKEEVRQASPVKTDPDPSPPIPETTLEKQLVRLNTTLYQISKSLEQIADKIAPEPGYEGTVTLAPKVSVSPPTSSTATLPIRQTANGLIVGDRVTWTARGETGTIIRILPGKKDAEVKFLIGIGTKTLPVDQLVPAPTPSMGVT